MNGLNSNTYLTFKLGSEYYAIPVSEVKEIVAFSTIPIISLDAPFFVIGITRLYDHIIPIINLACFFDRSKSKNNIREEQFDEEQFDTVIIYCLKNEYVGLKIRKMPGFNEFFANQLSNDLPPQFPYSSAITGKATVNSQTYWIMDIEKLLFEVNFQFSQPLEQKQV